MAAIVSIIIPVFNAENFISDTLDSILKQTFTKIEIIVVNDGSNDKSEGIIKSFNNERIIYVSQINKGVSSARNVGLNYAEGKYVVFFDADDIMTENFIFTRFDYLENNTECDLVCSEVDKFNSDGTLNGYYRGASEFAIEEILLYNKNVVTCPSNYMIRKDFLLINEINFNEKLSSTADRFFLLKCAKNGTVKFEKTLDKLHYRVSKKSMSNTMNEILVIDNEIFYKEIKFANLVPDNIKKSIFSKGYFILFASYLKISLPIKAFYYLLKFLKASAFWSKIY